MCGTVRYASTIATIPIGTFTRKIHRQPCSTPPSWMSRPPISGPIAVLIPTTEPNRPNARPRSSPRNSPWISPEFCGVTRPPPKPCTSRATTSMSGFSAAPQAALASVKTASPSTSVGRRPRASPIRPPATSTSPKASAYPLTTHCRALSPAWIPWAMLGSATFTMLTSSSTMKPATSTTASARQRRGSGW